MILRRNIVIVINIVILYSPSHQFTKQILLHNSHDFQLGHIALWSFEYQQSVTLWVKLQVIFLWNTQLVDNTKISSSYWKL